MRVRYGWKQKFIPIPKAGIWRPVAVLGIPEMEATMDPALAARDWTGWNTTEAGARAMHDPVTSASWSKGTDQDGDWVYMARSPSESGTWVAVGRTVAYIHGAGRFGYAGGEVGIPGSLTGADNWGELASQNPSSWLAVALDGAKPQLYVPGFGFRALRVLYDADYELSGHSVVDLGWVPSDELPGYLAMAGLRGMPAAGTSLRGLAGTSGPSNLVAAVPVVATVAGTAPPAFVRVLSRKVSTGVFELVSLAIPDDYVSIRTVPGMALVFGRSGVLGTRLRLTEAEFRWDIQRVSEVGPDMPHTVALSPAGWVFMRDGIPWVLSGRGGSSPLVGNDRHIRDLLIGAGATETQAARNVRAFYVPSQGWYCVWSRTFDWVVVYEILKDPVRITMLPKGALSFWGTAISATGLECMAAGYLGATDVVAQIWMPNEMGSDTWTRWNGLWKTTFFELEPGRITGLAAVDLVGRPGGGNVSVAVDNSDNGWDVKQSTSWSAPWASGEFTLDVPLGEARYWRVTVESSGSNVIQGLVLSYWDKGV